MNPRQWFREHSLRLLAIRDTPGAIAGGVAIGIFFGFTPLFGLKTLSAIFFAWLTRSNILAAVLAATVHDIILPFMPVIYWWEFAVGHWFLSDPHRWPPHLHTLWRHEGWRDWTSLFTVGKPLLIGSVICAAPAALASFAVAITIIKRHQSRKKKDDPIVADDVRTL
jgi:uncharacterized protein (DUF2062 family)